MVSGSAEKGRADEEDTELSLFFPEGGRVESYAVRVGMYVMMEKRG